MHQKTTTRLLELSDLCIRNATAQSAQLRGPEHTVLLIEACRALDYSHVRQFMAEDERIRIPDFDFDLTVRGWNPFLGLTLPHIEEMGGIPAFESSPESRAAVLDILYNLGAGALLRESARMIAAGMAEGDIDGTEIRVRMSERCSIDHFLDRMESDRLEKLEQGWPIKGGIARLITETTVPDLRNRLSELVFPWRPGGGFTMVGYGAAPDIDNHYFALVSERTLKSADDAGIHPDSRIGGVTGAELSNLLFMLTSFVLKHIDLVGVGKSRFPDVNVPMSLTIWESKRELTATLAEYTGQPAETIREALKHVTVRREHASYFRSEPTPFIPVLIEVSDDYLLRPVSSIFRNPFQGVRMLYEHMHPGKIDGIIRPRERWMISELYALFQGGRYAVMDEPTRLRSSRKIVTDIDAAVLDRTTGQLALFQLKWQDFSSNDVARQRSRASNFVGKVDKWANTTEAWIDEAGVPALLQSLRLPADHRTTPADVHLFAVGRSAARFRSYGYVPQNEAVAAASWRQFIRLRYETGPVEDVIGGLHRAIRSEHATPVSRSPLRQEIRAEGVTVVFEDLWNQFED